MLIVAPANLRKRALLTEERDENVFKLETPGRRLQLTVYIGPLKITGIAHLGVPQRTTSRRPSDILFYYPEKHIKIGDARVFDRKLERVVDEPPFIILNLDRVDAMYAEEID